MRSWVVPGVRDEVVVFVRYHADLTGIPVTRLISWIGIGRDKFYNWCQRLGRDNDHNGAQPRDFWLEDWEKQAIIDFCLVHQEDGYRRLTFMMIDLNIVAVSPASTYRVLKNAGLLRRWNQKSPRKEQDLISRPEHISIGTLM